MPTETTIDLDVAAAARVTAAIDRMRRLTADVVKLQEARVGLSPTQILALRAIDDGARQVRDVAHACQQHVSSASRLVDGLVNDGLISRTEDPADRRAVILELTELGAAKAQELRGFDEDFIGAIARGMSTEQLLSLADGAEAFAENAARIIREQS